jgi:hypothetical protein
MRDMGLLIDPNTQRSRTLYSLRHTYATFQIVHGKVNLQPIEFDKGRAAIAVSSLDKLPSVIDTLIAAVRNGELDEQLAQASNQSTPKSRANGQRDTVVGRSGTKPLPVFSIGRSYLRRCMRVDV